MTTLLKRTSLALILTALNYAILALLVSSTTLTSLPNLIAVIIVSFLIGYLTGTSEFLLTLLEGLALASVVIVGRVASWSSIRSAGELAFFSVTAYVLGSLMRSRGVGIGFTLFKPSLNKDTLTNALVRILTFSVTALTSYTFIGLFKVFFINVFTAAVYFINVAISLAYSTWLSPLNSRDARYRAAFNVLIGLLSTFSPITQPLLVLLSVESLKLKEPLGQCLYIGSSLVKRISGSKVGRGRLCVLTKRMENNHMVVVGASGTGKTALVKKLITEALRLGKFKVVVLDVHGEYSDVPYAYVVRLDVERPNIFSRLGKPPEVRAEELASLIADLYKLGEQQRYALHQVLLYAYRRYDEPSPIDVMNVLSDQAVINELSLTTDRVTSLITYVKSLTGPYEGRWINLKYVLEHRVVVFDLSNVGSASLQQFLGNVVIEGVSYVRRLKQDEYLTLIVVEEAHRFTSGGKTPLEVVFREGRKFGLAALVTFQDPLSIPPSLINNSKAVVSFQIPESRSATYIAKTFAGGKAKLIHKVLENLMNLPERRALVWVRGQGLYEVET